MKSFASVDIYMNNENVERFAKFNLIGGNVLINCASLFQTPIEDINFIELDELIERNLKKLTEDFAVKIVGWAKPAMHEGEEIEEFETYQYTSLFFPPVQGWELFGQPEEEAIRNASEVQ